MLCFRDMTYCVSDTCTNYDCRRHNLTERRDRERMPDKSFMPDKSLPTAWANFESDCPDYTPPDAA